MFRVFSSLSRWFQLAIAVAIGVAPAAASEAPTIEKPHVVVGGEIGYPPYSFIDGKGETTGFQVELTRAIARTMGLDVEIRLSPWPEARKALEDGTIDIIPGMFYSEERAKTFAFSPPFAIVSDAIFARKDSPPAHSVEDLRDKEIVVMRGEVMHDYIVKHRLTGRLLLAETPGDAMRILASGKGDYALVAQMPGFYWIKELKLSNVSSVGPSLEPFKNCFAVRKGNAPLLSRFTEGLNILKQTGEYDRLYEKWLGVLEPARITAGLVVKYAAFVIVPLVFLLAAALLWSWMLRSRVNRKTRELRESEEKFRAMVETFPLAIHLTVGIEQVSEYVNPTMVKLFGYTLEDIPTVEQWWPLAYPDETYRRQVSEEWTARVKRAIETQSPIEPMEVVVACKDGSKKNISWGYITLGEKSYSCGLDLTERTRAEEALLREKAFSDSLLDAPQDTVFLFDPATGEPLRWNRRFAEVSGYRDEEIAGMRAPGDFYGKDDLDKAEKASAILSSEGHATVEMSLVSKSGAHIPFEYSATAITTPDGRPLVLSIGRNISERLRMEEEKRSLEERLNRAEKMEALGTLAGGVAHDLNNVLGIVVGFAELLLDDVGEKSPLRSGLANIMDGGLRAAAIVQDLLTLARRGVTGRKVLNLNKIVVDCRNSPEFLKLSAHHSAARVIADLDPDLLNVSGSSVHLAKTLFNLVSNAWEAMPNGGDISIRTANQYLDKPIRGYDEVREGDYVVLSVSDTGEGIPHDNLKRVFEPFYTKKVMGRSGTGLGLAVVWGTVKDHNGYINAESEEGKGSTFTLYFPVTREDPSGEAAAVSVSEYMGDGESILVVDDVKGQRDLASAMLGKLGYAVAAVPGGEEAVAYLKEHRVDLMVLDMIMDPGMDGLDTYRSVIEIRPGQRAIIVSGFSESDRVRAAQALGAGAYVKKPYVMEKLGLAVRKELKTDCNLFPL